MTEAAQPTENQMPDNLVLIQINQGFAVWNEKEQAIQLTEDPNQSTVFPKDVAEKVVEALKANGVTEEMALVPVQVTPNGEDTAAAESK